MFTVDRSFLLREHYFNDEHTMNIQGMLSISDEWSKYERLKTVNGCNDGRSKTQTKSRSQNVNVHVTKTKD